jgi:hypothetical protein
LLVINGIEIIASDTGYDGCKSELEGCQHLWKEARKLAATHLAKTQQEAEKVVYDIHFECISESLWFYGMLNFESKEEVTT